MGSQLWKAIFYTEYGSLDVLHLAEVAKPTSKDHEVLIRYVESGQKHGHVVITVDHNSRA